MVNSSFSTYTIPSICSSIDSERIVVPTFQRGFIWGKNNIANFLSSIYMGYPVGTFIFLDEPSTRFDALSLKDFKPVTPKMQDTFSSLLYVLDGSQRLHALYKCLYADDPEFRYIFNFDTEEFMLKSKRNDSDNDLDLHSLFSPELFLQFQKSILSRENTQPFFDKAQKLHRAFSGYQIPVQIFKGVTLDDAMSISQIINTSGKHLQKSDLEKMWQKDK